MYLMDNRLQHVATGCQAAHLDASHLQLIKLHCMASVLWPGLHARLLELEEGPIGP